jgi:ABC-type dipeptide/oligopeptide/nickel transport system permease subunit
VWRRFEENRAAVVSLYFLSGLGLLALLTPLLPLQPPRFIDTSRQFQPPSILIPAPRWLGQDIGQRPELYEQRLREGFGQLDPVSRLLLEARVWLWGDWSVPSLFGTDKLGRDVLSRVFWGARVSLAVGIIAAFVSLVIGVTYGAVAGYVGGWVDEVLMRIVDVLYSVPFIFIVIFLITVLSAETKRLRPVGTLDLENRAADLETRSATRSDSTRVPPVKAQEGFSGPFPQAVAANRSGSASDGDSLREALNRGQLPQQLRWAAVRWGLDLPDGTKVHVVDPGDSWRIEIPTGRAYLLRYRPAKKTAPWELLLEVRERWVATNRIVIFYFVVGAVYWLTMARVVRGQVLSLKTEPFIEAARALGASHVRILLRHLVPNLWGVIIVYLTLTIPRVMLFEAFLSFLGLGVEPPDVSWGLLANEGLQVITPIKIYWWLVLFPSLALAATLLALNFLGDGLRDALDPRLRPRETA